jgi:hypothetical protein
MLQRGTDCSPYPGTLSADNHARQQFDLHLHTGNIFGHDCNRVTNVFIFYQVLAVPSLFRT